MKMRSTHPYLTGLTVCILTLSFLGLYIAPVETTDTVKIWFSNDRCLGLSQDNETAFFSFADITSRKSGAIINWNKNGLEADAYVGNVTILSLSDGLVMWANDSLSVYHFPIVGDSDEYYSDKLYFNVQNVVITASREGSSLRAIPYFDIHGQVNVPKSYAYVNLNQVEASLGIGGNTSYTLSVSMSVSFTTSFPAPPLHASNPSKITEQKTINFGSIKISCINGQRTLAHISFPYRVFSYSVKVPYVQTIFH